MIKQFVKDSAVYGLTTILARGISFLLLPFYTRVLMPEEYGIIAVSYTHLTLPTIYSV